MTASIFAIAMMVAAACPRPDAAYKSGYFSLYGQSPTDGTIDYHQNVSGKLPQDLSPYTGVIAVIDDCSLVGQDAWIRLTDYHTPVEYWNYWLPVKIFDCGGHAESIENFFKPNNIIGELGFYIANDAGVYHFGRGIAGDLALEDPTMACEPTSTPTSTPTPVNTPTPLPTETPTPQPAITRIILPRVVTRVTPAPTVRPVVAQIGDDFDFWEDIWTAPMFTEEKIAIYAVLLAVFVFLGIMLFLDLSVRFFYLLKRIQARLGEIGPVSRGMNRRKRR